MVYQAYADRYTDMKYNRVGKSGLLLPAISLGLWHNFGGVDPYENGKAMLLRAFDLGITHFDLANNYGPPPGSAEEMLGKVLKSDLAPYRDELVISTKAGTHMWSGPYGEWGSKKYMIASLDQSLKRLGLEYVDIFYSHRPDPNTPIEETMGALNQVVRQGKALYIGISSYNADQTKEAVAVLKQLGTPLLIHQHNYNMFERSIENSLQGVLEDHGVGSIAYGPLAQGMLTNKYLGGIPGDSRAAKGRFLKEKDVTEEKLSKINRLNELAGNRGQSLAQMALSWVLRRGRVNSALIGASRVSQIDDNVAALNNLEFSAEELEHIENILKS
ncbi:L-glyceraldehyde 3-phosphate reductase [Paenibacillus gansuensis]|uniref:L-glyceraldehyde 3-phosphate reductase n=1 Tax=Paenibacillus gansuensis TaxID=306542 RepID=A0ABW5PHE5_9BACL